MKDRFINFNEINSLDWNLTVAEFIDKDKKAKRSKELLNTMIGKCFILCEDNNHRTNFALIKSASYNEKMEEVEYKGDLYVFQLFYPSYSEIKHLKGINLNGYIKHRDGYDKIVFDKFTNQLNIILDSISGKFKTIKEIISTNLDTSKENLLRNNPFNKFIDSINPEDYKKSKLTLWEIRNKVYESNKMYFKCLVEYLKGKILIYKNEEKNQYIISIIENTDEIDMVGLVIQISLTFNENEESITVKKRRISLNISLLALSYPMDESLIRNEAIEIIKLMGSDIKDEVND